MREGDDRPKPAAQAAAAAPAAAVAADLAAAQRETDDLYSLLGASDICCHRHRSLSLRQLLP